MCECPRLLKFQEDGGSCSGVEGGYLGELRLCSDGSFTIRIRRERTLAPPLLRRHHLRVQKTCHLQMGPCHRTVGISEWDLDRTWVSHVLSLHSWCSPRRSTSLLSDELWSRSGHLTLLFGSPPQGRGCHRSAVWMDKPCPRIDCKSAFTCSKVL